MNKTLVLLGCWIMLDGVGSIVYYWNQSVLEHAVRCVRVVTGLLVTLIGAYL